MAQNGTNDGGSGGATSDRAPAAPDAWGFGAGGPFSEELPCEDPALCAEWDALISAAAAADTGAAAVREAAQKLAEKQAIPHSRRGKAWALLCQAAARRVPGLYQTLVATPTAADDEATAQIGLDLARSFPSHTFIASPRGQRALFDVLHAYVVYDRATGFCQGMAFVAGVLLMATAGDAEAAFWCLVALLQGERYGLAEFYSPGMAGIVRECMLFEHVLRIQHPRLCEHLEANGVTPLLYLVPWLIPLFANLDNWSAVMRAWDLFMGRGLEALRRLALALVVIHAPQLLALSDATALIPALINPPVARLPTARWLAVAAELKVDELYAKALIMAAGPRTPVAKRVTPTRKRLRAADSSDVKDKCAGGSPATRKQRKKEDVQDSKGLGYWLRKTLTPGSASPARCTQQKKRAATTSRPLAPRTIAALRRSNVVSAPPPQTTPMRAPSTASTTITASAAPAVPERTPEGPTVSPQSRQAFREFATPSPVMYRGKCWRLSSASPLSPVTMELCPLLSAAASDSPNADKTLEAAVAAAAAPEARYYD